MHGKFSVDAWIFPVQEGEAGFHQHASAWPTGHVSNTGAARAPLAGVTCPHSAHS